jgi:hypothetical protein
MSSQSVSLSGSTQSDNAESDSDSDTGPETEGLAIGHPSGSGCAPGQATPATEAFFSNLFLTS